jgi:hypothetical protein
MRAKRRIIETVFRFIAAAKVRISERKTKEKRFFLLLFRAEVPSATAKGTNKRAKNKRKSHFSFVLLSESTFGAAKGTNKRAKNKRKLLFSFVLPKRRERKMPVGTPLPCRGGVGVGSVTS